MHADIGTLKDDQTQWLAKWISKHIDGVIFVAGDDLARITTELDNIKNILSNTIQQLHTEIGEDRGLASTAAAGKEQYGGPQIRPVTCLYMIVSAMRTAYLNPSWRALVPTVQDKPSSSPA